MHLPDKVDELGVHTRCQVAPPVSQNPVDALHSVRLILAVMLIDDIDRLFGMDVVK